MCSGLEGVSKNIVLAKLCFGEALICVNSDNKDFLQSIIDTMIRLKGDHILVSNPKLSSIKCFDVYLVHILLLNENYINANNLACKLLDYINSVWTEKK